MKRHLGMGFDEWEALPWHEQDTYLEGLVAEFTDPDKQDTPPAFDGDLGMQVEQAS